MQNTVVLFLLKTIIHAQSLNNKESQMINSKIENVDLWVILKGKHNKNIFIFESSKRNQAKIKF
jgi:hypothetical protein